MEKEKKDLFCGIVLELFALLIFTFSFSIKRLKTATYDISSAVFPRICAGLLIFLGAALIFDSIRSMRDRKTADEKAEISVFNKESAIRMAVTISTFLLFILCLKKIGFLICGTILQFILMTVLAPKSSRTAKNMVFFFIISTVLAAVTDLLFVRVFYLMLPSGILSF